ncbi:Type II secretion system (T2SS), protein M subtype b [Tepidimonas alkaliphilus]|uniref:Type II secretion system (T2SS), protein M subtype b n=1 Tax=Tepidimonas alkaliphilus TaxID=2588942 RepID=A0A554W9E3_9BURK|nr:type II secretion system protein GspM [Tepidimonas alkaliphilus]TSE20193.1 Type II secretion system (T2SS), protein M subtype b [Tepidimonas alkaliphilus]
MKAQWIRDATVWRAFARRSAWGLLWVALLGLPPAGVAWYVAGKHRFAQRNLDDLAPRYARLAGVVEQQDALAARAAQAAEALTLRVLPADGDPQALTNDWLQRARNIMEQNGLAIESSQALAPQDLGPLRLLSMTVIADAELNAVGRVLAQLRSQQPPMHVVRFSARTTGPVAPNSNPRLKVQMQLAVYQQRLP